MTPTARTLKHLRDQGYVAQVVEKWNAFSRTRLDLFGVIDVVACGNGEIIGVQATSGSNVGARVKKALAEPRLKTWLESGGRFAVQGWAKQGPRGKRKTWTPIWREITHEDLRGAASGAAEADSAV